MRGLLDGVLYRPYVAWLRRLLAKPNGSMRGRLMLGLGPGVHWTGTAGTIVGITLAMAAGTLLLKLAGIVYPLFQPALPVALSAFGIGAMFGLLSPAMQAQSRLHQTRREQALLALLPGVPHDAALSRWLSWRMSAQFLLTWVWAVLALTSFGLLAGQIDHGELDAMFRGVRAYMIVASLPLVAFQWRRWAWLRAPTTLNALVPILVGLGLAAAALAGTLIGVRPIQSGVVFAVAALAWCAWRGWCMGREPSAFPVGRLA